MKRPRYPLTMLDDAKVFEHNDGRDNFAVHVHCRAFSDAAAPRHVRQQHLAHRLLRPGLNVGAEEQRVMLLLGWNTAQLAQIH